MSLRSHVSAHGYEVRLSEAYALRYLDCSAEWFGNRSVRLRVMRELDRTDYGLGTHMLRTGDGGDYA
jgi:hypothetical protein